MASTETISSHQLKRARTALWHQNGDALRTLDDARAWLETAGLVPYYPHAQFLAAPQPSFAEAVLGRPENGWVPQSAQASDAASAEESVDRADEDDAPDEDFADDEDLDDQDDEVEDTDEEQQDESEDAAALDSASLTPEAADAEVMLSNDDEFAEDEGDEIAELDRIHAGEDPLPNDLEEGTSSTSGAEEEPPAPEAVNGFSPEERETVTRTLARMVAEGSAVPLNLLGSTTGEPDFICSAQAFSFVYTLRGDKGWKQEPSQSGSMRVSPLAVKVYALLKDKGAMAPHELSTELGQGIVDSAVLRALSELWAIQRVIPVPDAEGAPTKWELLTGRFIRHLKAGANAGQPTALSALLSLYLSQAVAASSDEMEIFLSPLAARSRVREVVGALSASRQLESTVLEGKTLLFLPGALTQLPADEPATTTFTAVPRSRYEDDDRRAMIEERAAKFGDSGEARRSSYPVRKPAGLRGDGERGGRPGGPRSSRPDRPAGGGFADRGAPSRREGGFPPPRRSGSFGGPRAGGFAGRPDDRERRPFTRAEEGAAERPRNEFARPWDEEGGERRSSPPRDGGDRSSFSTRAGGDRGPAFSRGDRPRGEHPFSPRGGENRPFAPRGDRPYSPSGARDERRPFAARGEGERRPFIPREGGERRPFAPREGSERRPFTPRGDVRPFPSSEGGERRPYPPREAGDRKPFAPRSGGERRPFTPGGERPFNTRGGEGRPFPPRDGGDRKPFAPRGDRPFPPRGDRPFPPRGDRPFAAGEGGQRKPFVPREGGERRPFAPRQEGERRPFVPREGGDRRPFTPREGGDRRPFTPREGGDRRPFSGAGRPFSRERSGEAEGGAPRNRFQGEPEGGRPAFRSGSKPFAPGGGAKFGGGGFGRDRKGTAGGFGKPGFSPSRRGPGSGPGRGGAPKRRPE